MRQSWRTLRACAIFSWLGERAHDILGFPLLLASSQTRQFCQKLMDGRTGFHEWVTQWRILRLDCVVVDVSGAECLEISFLFNIRRVISRSTCIAEHWLLYLNASVWQILRKDCDFWVVFILEASLDLFGLTKKAIKVTDKPSFYPFGTFLFADSFW